jgi:hypothetical protein
MGGEREAMGAGLLRARLSASELPFLSPLAPVTTTRVAVQGFFGVVLMVLFVVGIPAATAFMVYEFAALKPKGSPATLVHAILVVLGCGLVLLTLLPLFWIAFLLIAQPARGL